MTLGKIKYDKPFFVQKKPKIVSAFLIVDSISVSKALDWITSNGGKASVNRGDHPRNDSLTIDSPRGDLVAGPGDFIIMGVEKEFYSVKPEIFEETYEVIS